MKELKTAAPATGPVPPIERSRIDAIFEQVAESRVATITAPAGFGKTSTLRRWADRFNAAGRKTLWIAGRDVAVDKSGFLGALRRASELTGLALPEADGTISLRARDGTNPVLLIDDSERLSLADQASLEALITAARDGMTTVLSSRGRSVLPVARLRSIGKLVEVGASDLRFSQEETARLIASHAIGRSTWPGPTLSIGR